MPEPTQTQAQEEPSFQQGSDLRLLWRLAVFFKPYLGLTAVAWLSYPVASLLLLIQPYLMKQAIDQHLVPQKPEGFGWLLLIYLLAIALEFGARYGQTLVTQVLGQRVTRDLRIALFQKLQEVDLAYLERHPVGRLITRVTSDVDAMQESFSTGAVSILGDLITLTGIVIMMLALDWKLTLFAFLVLPPLLLFIRLMRNYARGAFRLVRKRLSLMNGFLAEAIAGMRIAQVFQQEEAQYARFEADNAAHRDANLRAIRFDATTYAVVEGVSTLATASILLLGVSLVSTEAVSVGIFVAFVEYLRRFFQPITELSQKYTVLQLAMSAAERAVDLLDQKPSIQNPEKPKALAPLQDAIRFEDLSFRYTQAGPWVLPKLNLTLRAGETLAIVGATGSGKSTLVKLLLRFYEPSAGKILWDGTDLREVAIGDLRGRIAMVLQDPYLFDASLKANVAFGGDFSDAELNQAAERTRLSRVIDQLPLGWETPLGERGSRLSVGERQLLALTRALVVNPELLILDEATGSVDPETESLIQEGLDDLLQDRSAVIIAHRLSTVRRADRILVLNQGQIVEEGPHEVLLAQNGAYRQLYELQFSQAHLALNGVIGDG